MFVFYLNRRVMARILLVFVIVSATIGIFRTDIGKAAGDVVSVIVAGAKLHPIYAVDTGDKKVALSFDATWGSTRTNQILRIMADHNLKTTFFLTNIWLNQYPHLAREISEQGHEIGLHSSNHPRFTELSDEMIVKELRDNFNMVNEITGQKAILFRPPFGAYNNRVISIVQNENLFPIQWSIDSLDWKNLTADQIYHRVTGKLHPGAIVLFHNDGANTPAALEPILQFIEKEGYTIVPISELIYKKNYYIDVNGIQKLRQEMR